MVAKEKKKVWVNVIHGVGQHEPLLRRFFRFFDWTVGGCWEWNGGLTSTGYGFFQAPVGKRTKVAFKAHRFMYYISKGEMPKVVRHKCDNRKCVNPEHLEGGTQRDNIRDAIERGTFHGWGYGNEWQTSGLKKYRKK